MYAIKKIADSWAVYNNQTGKGRNLSTIEVGAIWKEFPVLKINHRNKRFTYYRNQITSLENLP